MASTDELDTEKILASSNAAGNVECDLPLVFDHAVHTPGLIAVHAVLPDLEPLEASYRGLSSISNLSTSKWRSFNPDNAA